MGISTGYSVFGWGRFLSVDPLQRKFASQSPYNFVLNSPISLIDPDGRAPMGPGDPPKALLWLAKKTSNFVNGHLAYFANTHVPAAAEATASAAQATASAFNDARESKVGQMVDGAANSITAPVVDVGTTLTFPIINQVSVIINEGVHEGGAYRDDSNILPTTFILDEDWNIIPQKEMAEMSAADAEVRGKKLMQNTIKVITTAVPGSKEATLLEKAATMGAKKLINEAAGQLLEVEESTKTAEPYDPTRA